MDTLGLLLAAVVHPADIQDRDGARLVLERLVGRYDRLLSRVNYICRLASISFAGHLLGLDALLGSVAVRPSYMCKSEPQIQEEVIFTMPSLGCCSSGSGTFPRRY